jgi:D-glycero-D-manno-heptose 1,7-bisphosphate phosphatase
MSRGSRPALILDRDGVVNHDDGYVFRAAECRFVDGVFALAAAFAAQGFALVIATNQSGIGRGYYGEAEFAAFMTWMKGEFASRGAPIDAVYHCPYHPTEGQGAYRRDSDWRKPRPGMLLQAAIDLGLDLPRSWAVGDKLTDIEAGRAAGVGTLILFDPAAHGVERCGDYWVVPDLASVPALQRAAER